MLLKKFVLKINIIELSVILALFFITSCMVNGRVVVRLDDIVATTTGKTEGQIINRLSTGLEKYKSIRRNGQYENALIQLRKLVADIEETYLILNDKHGSYRSSTVFTPRKIERKNLDDQNKMLADMYIQCLMDGVTDHLVTGDMNGYYLWLEKLGASSPLKSFAEDHTKKKTQLVEFCLKTAHLNYVEGRTREAITILEVLKKDLENIIHSPASRDYFTNRANISLGTYYLISGDLTHAENAIKRVTSRTNDNSMKIRALLLLSMIKEKRTEPHFAKLYLQKALSILKANPNNKNTLIFIGNSDSKIIVKHLVPTKWLLKKLESFTNDPNTVELIKKYSNLFTGNPYVRAADIFQKAGVFTARNNCLTRYEANITCKLNHINDLAAYARILVKQKQWERNISALWHRIDELEHMHQLTNIYNSALINSDLAFIYSSLAISIAMLDLKTVQKLTAGKWPVSLSQRTNRNDLITLQLIRLSKSKVFIIKQSNHSKKEKNLLKEELSKQRAQRSQLFSRMLSGDASEKELIQLQVKNFGTWQRIKNKQGLSSNKVLTNRFTKKSSETEQSILRKRDGLIEYTIIEDIVLVTIIKKDKLKIVPLKTEYSALAKQIRQFHKNCSNVRTRLSSQNALHLYDLLIKSLPVDLSDVATLFIAPDKLISRIPFTLLFEMANRRSQGKKNIVYTPTLSFLDVIRSDSSPKGVKTIALMGDPLPLDLHNALAYGGQANKNFVTALRAIIRKPKKQKQTASQGSLAIVASQEVNYGLLSRIPFTAKEVMGIKQIAESTQIQSDVLLAEKFTKRNIINILAKKPDYIHFATHAIISYEIPYIMEPSLLVSAFDRPIDHFFQAREIEKMNLSSTKLVVLSACKTGIDASEDFTGVAGLAKSFLAAGAKNIILTLWSIDDRATSVFMKLFYKSLFKGNTIRESLTTAKTTMMRKKQYKDPYFWAGFVLYGAG